MGFANSSCSFTRFRVLDSMTDEQWNAVPDKLRQYAFQDIDELPEMQAHGWVCFEDMLDSQWRTAPPQKGAYFVFSLRLDTRRIPAGVVKKRKKELKEQVLLRLRQRFLPVPAEFNVIWNTARNEVWFASTQNRMIDLFMEFFLQSFDVHLEQLTPYSLAETLLDEETMSRLDRMEPTEFAVNA